MMMPKRLDYNALAMRDPSLARGQVWCLKCGYTARVNPAYALRYGWPLHCGATMSLEPPKASAPPPRDRE